MSPSMHQHGMSAMNPVVAEVVTSGVIKGVLIEPRQLKVRHQPIPEWSMGGDADEVFTRPGHVDPEVQPRSED